MRDGIDLTDGDLYRPLMLLSAPIVASQLLQVAYNLINTFWVGQIGPDAVSAVSFAFPIVFLLISMGIGFSIAGTTLVSQNRGAGNDEAVDHVAGQTVSFTVVLALVVGVVGWFLSPLLVTLIGAPPGSQIHAWTVQFTRITFVGIVFTFGFDIFQALLRGFGDTKTPMYLMLFGIVLNVVLDPFLIYGFTHNVLMQLAGLTGLEHGLQAATGFDGFGVPGAALATVIARASGAAVGMAVLFSGRVGIHLKPEHLVPEPESVRQILEIGVPAGIGMSMRALGIAALTAVVAAAGPVAVAAFGIGNRLNSLVFLPSIGLAQGTTTAVGQNLGADEPERAERSVYYSTATIICVLAVVSVLAWFFAEPVVGVFVGDGVNRAAVVSLAVKYLHVIGPTFLFLGAFRVITSAFRGAGKTRVAMGFTILSLWIFRIPVSYALLHWTPADVLGVALPALGAVGVWYGVAFSNVATAVIAYLWFARGTWKQSVVDRGGGAPTTDD